MPNIRFTWKGKELVIPESKAFEAGDAVEQIVTLADFHAWGGRVKFITLARAFAALAAVAGVRVTPQEVHREMMEEMARQTAAMMKGEAINREGVFAIAAMNALQAVLMQALPEDLIRKAQAEGNDAGKTVAASSEPAS